MWNLEFDGVYIGGKRGRRQDVLFGSLSNERDDDTKGDDILFGGFGVWFYIWCAWLASASTD